VRAWLVLPTYNEAENLPRLIAAVRDLPRSFPVIVVDDASPDGTGRLAEELAAGRDDLVVVHRQGVRGFGEALTDGFHEALRRGAEAVFTMDADFSHDPADLVRLEDALADADLVIGSRYTAGGELRAWPLYRRLLSATANAFVGVLFHLPARDCTSGFRGYRRGVLEAIPWDGLHSAGYSFLVEVLYWAARRSGARVREVPICFSERREGKSKMGLREIVWGAMNLLKVRLDLMMVPRASAESSSKPPS
jgi:dolichol-phosphate mannosyltransferase